MENNVVSAQAKSESDAPTASHTPGPWHASETYPPGDYCIHARGIPWQLAYLMRSSQIDWPLEANALLIAAAPDMLLALRACELMVSQDAAPPDWDWIREVIAKAEGRTS